MNDIILSLDNPDDEQENSDKLMHLVTISYDITI
ncbi:hypothetical protein CGMCC3_g12038 [Colletotrichum fructicola]|nr:uncharacterized protein CGMCC3_g12038 [Colletotrichum fructicola]KAE9571845.1 hypothetical protein CGMCC3_g12038 [Colletotrichum fructicola]